MNNYLLIKHSWLLLRRKYQSSLLQILPSFVITFLSSFFYKIYFIDITNDLPNDRKIIFIYLLLTLVICLIISVVIFYKESKIELTYFNYLYWSGYKNKYLVLIILIKWSIIILSGVIIAVLLFLLNQTLFGNSLLLNEIIKINLFAIPLNALLLPGIIIALLTNRPLNEFDE